MTGGDDARRQRFWDLHGFAEGRGLEVGPLHRALVRRDEADVRYVDVQDRDGLVAHYADDSGVDCTLIPEIDYPLILADGTTRTLARAAEAGAPFSWVVASHVVEHVPDVIGWLADIAEVSADGAALVLAVPDRRYCFDVLRPPTTVGQMLEAHLERRTTPSPRAVYDYFSSVVDYDVRALWAGEVPSYDRRLYAQPQVEAKLAESLASYVDAHVWLFSPQSFVEQLHELRVSGRSAWWVEQLEDTRPEDNEFLVVLRRLPRDADGGAPVAGELLPDRPRPDWVEPAQVPDLVPHLRARTADLERALAEQREKLAQVRARQRAKVAARDAELARLRGDLDALRARTPAALVRRAARGAARRVRRG